MQCDEAKAEVGSDLSLLCRLIGHTTTQPSSIEEEGKGFQDAACCQLLRT